MAGLSEFDLAKMVVHRHQGDIRRVPEWSSFVLWLGQRWERDRESALLKSWVANVLKGTSKEDNAGLIDRVISLIPSVAGVMSSPEEWDADPYLFGWADGIYDLRTGRNLGFERDRRVTLYSPFRPEGRCDRFRSHLQWQLNGNREVGAYLAPYLGYCLTGLRREQSLLINQGPGGCGKNVLWDAISAVMGPYAGICPRGLLVRNREDRYINMDYAVADLSGKRLMVQSETERGGYLNEEMMKSLTGDREVKGRDPYSRYTTFVPQAKFVLVTNYWPNFKSLDRSMMRRLIPWEITVCKEEAEMDKDLLNRMIEEEGNGIANALTCWALRYFEQTSLELPADFQSRKEAYKREMDEFGRFLEECTVKSHSKGPEDGVYNKVLYPLYAKWGRVNGCTVLSQKSFSAEMNRNGYEQHKDRTGRIWLGLSVVPGVQEELAELLKEGGNATRFA